MSTTQSTRSTGKHSLCLFIGYTQTDHQVDLPYIKELQRHFDRVLVLTNIKPDNADFEFMVMPNKGYDFGFTYRALQTISTDDVHTLGVINNSNVLLKDCTLDRFFEWCEAEPSHFCGSKDLRNGPFDITNPDGGYYLQSHFLIFKQDAIRLLKEFFTFVKFERFFEIEDQQQLKASIIAECEIGLSQFMIKRGCTPSAWISVEDMYPKYQSEGLSIRQFKGVPPLDLITRESYPCVKKHVFLHCIKHTRVRDLKQLLAYARPEYVEMLQRHIRLWWLNLHWKRKIKYLPRIAIMKFYFPEILHNIFRRQ